MRIELSNNKETQGKFVHAQDYILDKFSLPTDTFPIDPELLVSRMGVNILMSRMLGNVCIDAPYVSIVPDNGVKFIRGNVSLVEQISSSWTRAMSLAIALQFLVRGMDSSNISRDDQLYVNGINIARKLLIPDRVLVPAIREGKDVLAIRDMLNSTMNVPVEEVRYRINKVKTVYNI